MRTLLEFTINIVDILDILCVYLKLPSLYHQILEVISSTTSQGILMLQNIMLYPNHIFYLKFQKVYHRDMI